MSTKEVRTLESAALRAHRRGIGWTDFWQEHGAAVCQAEPHNRQRFQRLVRRLLALVSSGDLDGQQPIPQGVLWGMAEPWEVDNMEATQ
jgi:hypothetical protein